MGKLNPFLDVGEHCIIDESARIGNGTTIGNFVIIEEDVVIGDDCFIGNYCQVRKGTTIGNDSQLRNCCLIEPETKIGNDVMIRNHVSTAQGQVIEAGCYVGPHVSFTNANIVRSMTGEKMPIDPPPYLENNVTVFTHAVILSGVTLKKGCVIGAGAVVTKNTEVGKTYLGVPARSVDKFTYPRYDLLMEEMERASA
jgi:UDP-2-acetamido-3-amino-2,3-dideoxy-glucuronate N-acetyltransferase